MNKIGDLRTMNGTREDFIVVESFPEIDYVLLKRNSKYEPWVAAWAYNEERECWGQGHYFIDMIDAMRYIDSKLRENEGEEI